MTGEVREIRDRVYYQAVFQNEREVVFRSRYQAEAYLDLRSKGLDCHEAYISALWKETK